MLALLFLTAQLAGSAEAAVLLDLPLVSFNSVSRERKPLADWTADPDARRTGAEVRRLIEQFASAELRDALRTTPLFQARLYGASGHTSEEPEDPRAYVVYIDPYRATSTLHAACTIVHELTHVASYRKRGFHANRAASAVTLDRFIELGSSDELAAHQAEAALIRGYMRSLESDSERRSLRRGMNGEAQRWPPALLKLLDGDVEQARSYLHHQVTSRASRYWQYRNKAPLPAAVADAVARWARSY